MFYTTDQIIEVVKTRCLMPSSQATFTDSDIIRFVNEELQTKLVPQIISQREDFFLYKEEVTIVANQSSYTLPERAIGNNFKDIFYVDTGGNKFPIQRMNIEDIPYWPENGQYLNRFYMLGDSWVLYPTPNQATGHIDVWYYERPNQLVANNQCGQITGIAVGATTTVYTVNNSVAAYAELDFLSGRSPFALQAKNVVPVSSTSTTVTITNTDVENNANVMLPRVGDYINQAQYACIPMVPEDAHPLLTEMVAGRIVQALGDTQKMQDINQNIAVMQNQFFQLIANRPEQRLQRTVNPTGLHRSAGFGQPWGWGW